MITAIEELAALLGLPSRIEALAEEVLRLRDTLQHVAAQLPPALVDVKTAALQLGVSVVTVRRLVARGSLPSRRVGRALRIDMTAVRGLAAADIARAAFTSRRREHAGSG